MLQEYDSRERQNDFLREGIFPLLSLDFQKIKKYLNRTEEEKILDIQKKSGLSEVLNSENTKKDLVGDLLKSVRERIAIADLCKQKKIPVEFEEYGWRKGKYTDKTINSICSVIEGMSVPELKFYLDKYNLHDSEYNFFSFSLMGKRNINY
jgi:hypothetical protein